MSPPRPPVRTDPVAVYDPESIEWAIAEVRALLRAGPPARPCENPRCRRSTTHSWRFCPNCRKVQLGRMVVEGYLLPPREFAALVRRRRVSAGRRRGAGG